METFTIGKTEVLSLMAVVEHWYAGWRIHRRLHMDLMTGDMTFSPSEIPSWVNITVKVVNRITGATFDYMSGIWSAESVFS